VLIKTITFKSLKCSQTISSLFLFAIVMFSVHAACHDVLSTADASTVTTVTLTPPALQTPLSVHRGGRPQSFARPLLCTVPGCGFSTEFVSSFRNHAAVHSTSRPFACTVPGCGFASAHRGSLNNHLATHGPKQVYACEAPGCAYIATRKRNLEDHVSSAHTATKPFVCELCGFASAYKRSLTGHMRARHDVHERQFTCAEPGCAFASAFKHALAWHAQTKHSGSRPSNKRLREQDETKDLADEAALDIGVCLD
jgi:hypothetical protein